MSVHAICQAAGWFTFGHKFEERREQVPIPELVAAFANPDVGFKTKGATVGEMVCRDAYVRDVCVRCGATIERGAA